MHHSVPPNRVLIRSVCAPSCLTNPLCWIASPIRRKASTPMARASAAHSAVGRPVPPQLEMEKAFVR